LHLKANDKGYTIVELLVVVIIMSLIIVVISNFLIDFTKHNNKQEIKSKAIEEVKEVFRIIEDDIRHAGFAYPGNNPNINQSICRFFIDDNCSVSDETFCKANTDRLFIANGWKIIRDHTLDNCPDGYIDNLTYETLASSDFYANITTYTSGSKMIGVSSLDIDSTCRRIKSSTVLCGTSHAPDCKDIKARESIIICGCSNSSGQNSQEGRRISNIVSNALNFLLKESSLNYDNCSNGVVLPAISWYVRKDSSSNDFWLYRNQVKVLKHAKKFNVLAGYDNNNNGIIENSELYNKLPENADIRKLKYLYLTLQVSYVLKNKEHSLDYSFKVEITP
jgi:prepilin-type N-terminal cleavage/methylation domain-containing protein